MKKVLILLTLIVVLALVLTSCDYLSLLSGPEKNITMHKEPNLTIAE